LVELITELLQGVVCTVDLHFDLTFLGAQHDRLLTESTDHIERTIRNTVQRQFLHVGGNPAFDDLPELRGQRKEPIRWAESLNALMRPLVVVVLHPQPNPVPRLLEAVKLGAAQKVLPDRFPEPLDLAQCHRVMRLAAEVVDPVFLQLMFEPRLAMPSGVLSPVIGEHFLRDAVLTDRRPVDIQHMFRTLAAEQIQPNDVAGVIINEADQVCILAAQPKREDVCLPHLVGSRPLKEAWLGWILLRLPAELLNEVLRM